MQEHHPIWGFGTLKKEAMLPVMPLAGTSGPCSRPEDAVSESPASTQLRTGHSQAVANGVGEAGQVRLDVGLVEFQEIGEVLLYVVEGPTVEQGQAWRALDQKSFHVRMKGTGEDIFMRRMSMARRPSQRCLWGW